jgi:hypothetical protein
MHTRTKLSPIVAAGAARRPTACPAFRLPQVSELPLRLEPVGPDTFGGLVGGRRPAQSSATRATSAHS